VGYQPCGTTARKGVRKITVVLIVVLALLVLGGSAQTLQGGEHHQDAMPSPGKNDGCMGQFLIVALVLGVIIALASGSKTPLGGGLILFLP
jgi:hypothetical protein